MKKYLAEVIGTAALVLIGCGAVVVGGFGTARPLGILPVALAFGLTVTAMAYAVGPISGGHFNPAVTAAVWAAGRMPTSEVPGYIVAQIIGAFVGAGFLALILMGKGSGYNIAQAGLGQNGFGPGYLGGFSLQAALLVEILATLIFTVVILGVTGKAGSPGMAGLVIGLTLALLHLPFINVTGLSVNPARSLAPAVYVGGNALAQVWVFLVAPVVGGLIAGFLFRGKVLED